MNQQGSQKIDAYRRASNYPAAGQLYLPDTPLLRRPLKREDVKRKLIAHKNCIHEIGQDICCAMSGKQSLAKKNGSSSALLRGLFSTAVLSAASALSSTSRQKTHGCPLQRTAGCTSTACGSPVP